MINAQMSVHHTRDFMDHSTVWDVIITGKRSVERRSPTSPPPYIISLLLAPFPTPLLPYSPASHPLPSPPPLPSSLHPSHAPPLLLLYSPTPLLPSPLPSSLHPSPTPTPLLPSPCPLCSLAVPTLPDETLGHIL